MFKSIYLVVLFFVLVSIGYVDEFFDEVVILFVEENCVVCYVGEIVEGGF